MTAQLSLEVNRFTSTADSLPQRPGSQAGLKFATGCKVFRGNSTRQLRPYGTQGGRRDRYVTD